MSGLRVKEIRGERGKMASRKAVRLGKTGNSPMASLLTSPASSAAPSRVASDLSDAEHDTYSEDDVTFDDSASLFNGSELDDSTSIASTFNPDALIAQLQDRKNNNSDAREKYLEVFISVLRTHYSPETHDWLDAAAYSLATLFLKDADRSPSARERLLSLQAFALVVSTAMGLDIFGTAKPALHQILAEDDDDDCRTHAIDALCACAALCTSGDDSSVLEVMEFLLEIIQTDGESIDAYDNVPVALAALQGWCFLATYPSDLSVCADRALDAFVEQLDSSNLEMQAMSGSCIAFIFEAARLQEEETEEPLELPWSPPRLLPRVRELAKLSSKVVSRRDRRTLRESLVSVATSLERGVGPDYSTALKNPGAEEEENEFGYRKRLRVNKEIATIDTWRLDFRVNVLRTIFRGSLGKHVFDNEHVIECLKEAEFHTAAGADDEDEKARRSKKNKPIKKSKGLDA